MVRQTENRELLNSMGADEPKKSGLIAPNDSTRDTCPAQSLPHTP